jgi:magnesium-protoporphyrin IX monomethyl ester (oxidative) cyclase
MIKVMLINPPQKYYSLSSSFGLSVPLGLLSIAASIKDICNLQILDCLEKEFSIQSDNGFTLYGMPFKKIEEEIRAFNPEIAGISIPYSAQSENAEIVCKICNKINPDMKIVVGGAHASLRFKELLENDICDYCVVGEGEETAYELIGKINNQSELNNIPGLASKANNTIHFEPRKPIEPLDNLSIPAYGMIDLKEYQKNKYLYSNRSSYYKNSISMITSRGCPFNCVFCSIRLHMGSKFRSHSPEYVIDHLKYLIKEYGIKNYHFEDDNISLNKKRFESILDGIIKNNLNIKWDTPNGVRADTLNFNLLEKMKRSGCSDLTIAVESGNQDVLNRIIRKNTSLEKIIEITKHCKKLKIPLRAFYVVGFPGETINNMQETINLALELYRLYEVSPTVMVATPLYGTELYDQCIKDKLIEGYISDKEFSIATGWQGEPMISTADFTTEDIKQLLKDFQKKLQIEKSKNYIKHPIKTMRKITRPNLLKTYLQQMYQLIKM